MIGYLEGTLLHKQPPHLLVAVQGVGYELEAPLNVFPGLPEPGGAVKLHTHMQVREDAQLLFGFSEPRQRDFFRLLLKVSGVGPRVGLAILSGLTVDDLILCIHENDIPRLVRVPGIGRKTAERLIVDLRDRLDAHIAPEGAAHSGGGQSARADAISALVALGYKPQDASRAVGKHDEAMGSEELIRLALQSLSGAR